MTIEMAFDDVTLGMTGDGTWTTDGFECTVTTGLGGLEFAQSIVVTPETLWLDNGNGYEPAPLFGGAAQEVMPMCPASPLFWADFTSDGLGQLVGDVETIAGREAIRTDLTEAVGLIGGFGMIPGFDDANVFEMVMWVDADTNVVLGLDADIELGGDFLAEIGAPGDPTTSVDMVMSFRVDQINDPALAITIP
jgi:hypothetical protein